MVNSYIVLVKRKLFEKYNLAVQYEDVHASEYQCINILDWLAITARLIWDSSIFYSIQPKDNMWLFLLISVVFPEFTWAAQKIVLNIRTEQFFVQHK